MKVQNAKYSTVLKNWPFTFHDVKLQDKEGIREVSLSSWMVKNRHSSGEKSSASVLRYIREDTDD